MIRLADVTASFDDILDGELGASDVVFLFERTLEETVLVEVPLKSAWDAANKSIVGNAYACPVGGAWIAALHYLCFVSVPDPAAHKASLLLLFAALDI